MTGALHTPPAWDADEIAWARECARAGDTPEEVAEMAGRTVEDVKARIGFPRLTPHERTALQMYLAGSDVRSIGRALKPTSTRPDSLAACYVRRLRDKGFDLPARVSGRSPDAEARRYA